MNALILNGTDSGGRPEMLNRSQEMLSRKLDGMGWRVHNLNLSEKDITPCCGRFKCWVQTPGECAIKDDQLEVIQHIIKSDTLIYLTPVTFGGFSFQLKKALDRMIPIILPFFIKVAGEIHHPQRYPNKRRIIVLGSQKDPNPETEKIFHGLVRRNGLNMDIQDIRTMVVPESITDKELSETINNLLENTEVSG